MDKWILIKASLYSLVITIAGMLVNLVSYRRSNKLLFAVRLCHGDVSPDTF